MSIEALRAILPAYAHAMARNLEVLAEETVLDETAKWSCFVASALAVGEPRTLKAVNDAAHEAGLTPEAFEDAKTAAATMAMTNVYFRAVHLITAREYEHLPSRLRFSRDHSTAYELCCMAVSAINGCGACLDSHEAELRRRGVEPVQIQAALRIGAVVNAVARVLATEPVDHPPFSGVLT
ncbi:carboxymuconolactone decarboxylase family protein [Caulobacter sp.]|uniref:carboxymuconolactone decarboxylase family protein n=1 Tax=Caulobacter sp. TaxID=78 RepID=UPI001B06CBC6|nr:carboxymuconolactone decarboxylase family protein [Caulobacter sp.]MBO9546054.1 carboxymuconolactone decarboxylase family protein [Caulobacter sp.]